MTTFCPRCGQAGRDEAVVMPLVSVWASCERCHFVWRASLLDTMKELASRGARRTLGEKVVDRYAPVQPVQLLANDAAPLQPVDADRVAQWLASQEKTTTLKLAPIAHVEEDAAAAAEDDPVEAFISHMDPAGETHEPAPVARVAAPVTAHPAAEDFYAFFAEEAPPVLHHDQSVEEWIGDPAPAAEVDRGQTLVPVPGSDPRTVRGSDPSEDEVPAIAADPRTVRGSDPGRDEVQAAGAAVAASPLEATVDQALISIEDLYDTFKRLEEQLGGMEKWCEELAATPASR